MENTDRPSVLIIFLDQLSAKWVEAAERGIAPLPNVQRLKQCGVTFTNAITSNPVCCPAAQRLRLG